MKGAIHKKVKRFNIEIPGIICDGLCYTLLIEVPDLPIDHPRVNFFNCSQLIYGSDELSVQTLSKIQQQQQQQQQHLTLMDMIYKSPHTIYSIRYFSYNPLIVQAENPKILLMSLSLS